MDPNLDRVPQDAQACLEKLEEVKEKKDSFSEVPNSCETVGSSSSSSSDDDDSKSKTASTQPVDDDDDAASLGNSKSYSYTYWKRKGVEDEHLFDNSSPKLVEAETIQPLTRSLTGPSAWNSAGTWEERIVTSELQSSALEIFANAAKDVVDGKCLLDGLAVTAVDKLEGKSSICFVRKQPRLGFEISFKLEFKALDEDPDADGFADISEFCDYDEDFSISCVFTEPKSKLKKSVQSKIHAYLTYMRKNLSQKFIAFQTAKEARQV